MLAKDLRLVDGTYTKLVLALLINFFYYLGFKIKGTCKISDIEIFFLVKISANL